MKTFLSAILLFLASTASALAQAPGSVVVNTGNKIDCVTAKGEQGFDATSWSIGGSVSSNYKSSGGGVMVGLPSLKDLVITKNLDACSPQLVKSFLSASTGVLPTVKLVQYSGGENPFALATITLTNAIINTYTISGAPSVHPVETLDFGYVKLCITSNSLSSTGVPQQPVTTCYDVAGNKVS